MKFDFVLLGILIYLSMAVTGASVLLFLVRIFYRKLKLSLISYYVFYNSIGG